MLFGKDAPIQLKAAIPFLSSPIFFNVSHPKGTPALDVMMFWHFMFESTNGKDQR